MKTAMRTLLMTAFCSVVITCVATGMSGSVYFANRYGVVVDTPFYGQDGVFLSGPEYAAQLYAWKEDEGFLPICFPVLFAGDGYFRGRVISIRFLWELSPAWIQVRAWEREGGPTFEEAALAGAWSGTSDVLYVRYLGSGDGSCGEGGGEIVLGDFGERVTSLDVPFFPALLEGLKYPGPPLVVRQPVAQTVRAREQVQLSVVASSGVQAFYQWHQSPSDAPYGLIPWATNATYTTPALSSTTTYWVTIRNSAGTTTSEQAIITVLPWLSISALPQDGVELTLRGVPETEFEIQYAASLSSGGWLTLTNITTRPGGSRVFDDNSTRGSSTRFYRAVSLP